MLPMQSLEKDRLIQEPKKCTYTQLHSTMSPTDTTKHYPYHDGDATMESESTSLTHPLPTPYQDSYSEERPVRTHRAHSWGSDDTLGGGYCVQPQAPASPKAAHYDKQADLDLEFLEVDASYRHRNRRRPWIIFIVALCAVVV